MCIFFFFVVVYIYTHTHIYIYKPTSLPPIMFYAKHSDHFKGLHFKIDGGGGGGGGAISVVHIKICIASSEP